MEKLDFLIRYLIEENKQVRIEKEPQTKEEKQRLYRSLCNIREAKPISEEYLKVEAEYLQEELASKKITNINAISTISQRYPECKLEMASQMCLWKGDITLLEVDTIVNAANQRGLGCFVPCHKCIDNQIHTSAGVCLRLACDKIMQKKNYQLKTGEAILTEAHQLPSKFVLHTVGPIIYGNTVETKKEKELANCYLNCLELAMENNIKSIAFPCISTGEFCFPKDKACEIAITTVNEFLRQHSDFFDKVIFNVFSEEDFALYEQFIKQN